jgi:hypothetical protein
MSDSARLKLNVMWDTYVPRRVACACVCANDLRRVRSYAGCTGWNVESANFLVALDKVTCDVTRL